MIDTEPPTAAQPAIPRAQQLTVGAMLCAQATSRPHAAAVVDGDVSFTYARFNERVNRARSALEALGVRRGCRIGVLSENRSEYLELVFACAKLGGIVCALNWRLSGAELWHCIELTTPSLLCTSQRHAGALQRIEHGIARTVCFGDEYERLLAHADAKERTCVADAEDGLLILYTSGTTGLPKGALISHRAELARMHVNCADMGLDASVAFPAWPPFFHMASMDQCIGALCLGAKVTIVDGFDVDRILDLLGQERLWWLVLLPGTIDRFCAAIEQRDVHPAGLRLVGAMADLVPPHQIASLTRLVNAPYANTFGSTETGIPPASAGRIAVGIVPESLAKQQNTLCDVRLVDSEDRDVPHGCPGELAFRGPTLFSGYWNAPEANREDFRGGWFHLGDAFVRNGNGTLSFVDRVKYLIKSGGENIYPAEIERVLLADPRVDEAVVVRRPDAQWGEVPVAFVARNDAALDAKDLIARCHAHLARYKQPKELQFVALDAFPRSTTGKVQRHEIERWVASKGDTDA